jgi:hypothetical protein
MAECWQKINTLLDNPDQTKALGNYAQQTIGKTPDILNAYLAEIQPYL